MNKKLLVAAGFLFFATAASAQDHNGHEHVSTGLNKTVFREVPANSVGGSKTIQAINAKVQQAFPGWNAKIDPAIGSFTDVYGSSLTVPGADALAKAQYLMGHQLTTFNLVPAQWTNTRNYVHTHATYVDFTHKIDGREVVFSRLSFRFATNGELVRIQMRNYGQPAQGLQPIVTVAKAKESALQSLNGATIASSIVDENWVWFPVPVESGYALHPAYPFTAEGTAKDGNMPVKLSGYVDALSGELLYRDNAVKESFDLKMKGVVYATNTSTPTSVEALPNMEISIGGNTYRTDANGDLNLPALNTPVSATIKLQGLYSKVNTGSTNGSTPSYTRTFTDTAIVDTFITNAPSSIRHVNAYYHVNRIHDVMKDFYPSFTGLDFALPTNVDVTGSCNAFYNGTSINFYTANATCNSFAEIGDIVYHEYGHGISGRFYSAMNAGAMRNGALNEGNSDVWAFGITNEPILGENSYVNGGYIRRYDNAPAIYPKDINGEVHRDGEIIAGAWYDLALNLNSFPDMYSLFASTYFDLPDGPAGSEGDVYHQVLITALLNDDNDNNLNNGTPHFVQIVSAFARHGIYLLGDAVLDHTELAHQPANTTIKVDAGLTLTSPGIYKDFKLFYRVRGNAWDSVAMQQVSPFSFTADIPAQTGVKVLDYYFRVTDSLAPMDRIYFPKDYDPELFASQSNIPYQFATDIRPILVTDFETTPSPAWSIGNNPGDNATGGLWILARPLVAYQTGNGFTALVSQTGNDHTNGSGKCLVTGNGATAGSNYNSADVDGGLTTVLTPEIDLAGFEDAVIEYYRWYSNNRGLNARSDAWQTKIRSTTSTIWLTVENTVQSDQTWRRRIFRLREFMPIGFDKIQMQFLATDATRTNLPSDGQNNVEALVDDFIIYDRKSSTTAVTTNNIQRAKIFPSPSDAAFQIELTNAADEGTIALYNVNGQMLKNLTVVKGQANYTISTMALPTGSYMLYITTPGAVEARKVQVVH